MGFEFEIFIELYSSRDFFRASAFQEILFLNNIIFDILYFVFLNFLVTSSRLRINLSLPSLKGKMSYQTKHHQNFQNILSRFFYCKLRIISFE